MDRAVYHPRRGCVRLIVRTHGWSQQLFQNWLEKGVDIPELGWGNIGTSRGVKDVVKPNRSSLSNSLMTQISDADGFRYQQRSHLRQSCLVCAS